LEHVGGANDDDHDTPPPEPQGQKALRQAIAYFFNNENSAQAVADLLTTLGDAANK
jgi:hypothetical protein